MAGDPRFQHRTGPKGIYTLYPPIARADENCISLINPERDFTYVSNSWGGGNHTTRFNQRGSRNEVVVQLFGEVLSPENGTKMGLIGSLSLSDDGCIEDGTSVRDVMALGLPTMATKELKTLYDAQIDILGRISRMDLNFPGSDRNWVQNGAISVALGRKYDIVESTQRDTNPVKRRKTDEDMDVSDTWEEQDRPSSISMSSSYSPTVLADYNPRIMKLNKARLMQQPLHDIADRLVPPWEAQKTFRQGTVVQVKAHLNVHHFPPRGNRRAHNSYQIMASYVRVIAKSPLPFDSSILRPHTNISYELSDLIDAAGENADTPSSAAEVDKSLESDTGTGKRHHEE